MTIEEAFRVACNESKFLDESDVDELIYTVGPATKFLDVFALEIQPGKEREFIDLIKKHVRVD